MLEPMKLSGHEDARGVHFPMRDGDRHVRVFVERAALGRGSAIALGDALARFGAFRSVYESVARAKYETGAFKASMTIDVTDLNKYLDERRAATPVESSANSDVSPA
jgi:Protein of unknown function (DUF1488)